MIKISDIYNISYYLEKGVKNCYLEIVNNCDIEEIKKLCNTEHIYYLFFDCNDGTSTAYFYKYSFMTDVIKSVESKELPSYISEYVIGKLLSYSDEAMEKYLTTRWDITSDESRGEFDLLNKASDLLKEMQKDTKHDELRYIINKLSYEGDYASFEDEKIKQRTERINELLTNEKNFSDSLIEKVEEQKKEISLLEQELEHWKELVLHRRIHH